MIFHIVFCQVCGTIYPKGGKIIWVNMRQEPNVYINGEPVCARSISKSLLKYLVFSILIT